MIKLKTYKLCTNQLIMIKTDVLFMWLANVVFSFFNLTAMQQSSQNLPPTLTPEESTQIGTQGAVNPATSVPTDQVAAATAAVGTDSNPPIPKRRKPNASGPRKTSVV